MFKVLFNIIINLMATIIQIISTPLNLAITSALPSLSDKISTVTSGISNLFSGFSWGLSLLPPGVLGVLLFVVSVEIAKHTIFVSTHALIKVWNLFQKVKFW